MAGYGAPPAAASTTFTVTRTSDTNDGACTPADCSLREAVRAANAAAGADVIVVPAGTYQLTLTGAGENHAASGDLDITEAVTIRGHGAPTTIVKGLGADRIFEIRPSTSATISRLTIRGGNPGDHAGGGILVSGTLTLRYAVVASNTANGGGGIFSSGTLTMSRTVVTGNHTVDGSINPDGGGLDLAGPTTIVQSTLSGNQTSTSDSGETKQGGGIFIMNSSLTIRNSSIEGNSGSYGGGFLSQNASVTLNNDTIAQNTSRDGTSGGINHFSHDGSEHITVGNTIVANNTPANCDVTTDTVDSTGHNLDTGTTCHFTGVGDDQSTPAGLTPLAANGGPTPTIALQTSSLAVDHGGAGCEAKDQRGVTRPQGAACEIGAYELPVAVVTRPTSSTLHHRAFTFAWNSPGGRAGTASFDVRFHRRTIGASQFGRFHAFLTHTTIRSATFTGDFGFEYCFSARAVDRGGHPSTFGPERCTEVTH
ncbi:MAG: choice-of-anchor Q domain-containing protein [Actinomycetota bacterium]